MTTAAEYDRRAEEVGKQARKRVSRKELGEWGAEPGRPDPVSILEKQNKQRVPELVPIRMARMAISPFTFLRGSAAIMAYDLGCHPDTGLYAQLCGDAHLANFGLFGTPERNLVFDVNDFDETLPGPFEWDVKRLATSVAVAALVNGCTDEEAASAAEASASGYRRGVEAMTKLDSLSIWYDRVDAEEVLANIPKHKFRKAAEKTMEKARSRTSLQALNKLTEPGPNGVPQIKNQPPLLVPIGLSDEKAVHKVLTDYRASLPDQMDVLLDRYTVVDYAMKVVGVGSVGTRCYIALLMDKESGAPLFLQLKEADTSVLAPYTKPSKYTQQGQRVVEGQKLMQAASDIFLGWATGVQGVDFYWRQFRDMKGSADISSMTHKQISNYGGLCGGVLARAHCRSGDPIALNAYIGSGDKFDKGIRDFAMAYSDQNDADYHRLLAAIADGEVKVAANPY
ncbi:DUF2252 domain-containing protein [Nocardia camponoti]|uniref:DUF2252 domain-containing protein n=1 Tax=Nocardia camponoti TaxID=1616106 RepID=A0A917QCC8_9NOCA|nr:DUF2252 domain-containing protein [Nocardia camponoti]GGK43449.1 hypothetical protein GCM10011591_13880 [Nocardia camponoti]